MTKIRVYYPSHIQVYVGKVFIKTNDDGIVLFVNIVGEKYPSGESVNIKLYNIPFELIFDTDGEK